MKTVVVEQPLDFSRSVIFKQRIYKIQKMHYAKKKTTKKQSKSDKIYKKSKILAIQIQITENIIKKIQYK